MRAMAVTAYGEPLEPIELAEPDVPDGYALIQVETCGVCFSDVKTSRGRMPFSDDLRLPHVPGHEIFGRVLGTNPAGLLPEGERVVVHHYWPCGRCPSCLRGDETLCSDLAGWVGFTSHGGFRERLAAPVDRLLPVPEGIEASAAAVMTCALGTAVRSVLVRGGVRSGDRVAILGLGGVGIHAAQVARAAGAQVTGIDVSEVALGAARSLGLEAHRSADDLPGAREDAGAGETDVVIDTVGRNETLALAARLVRPGGRVVGVGYLADTALVVATARLVLGELAFVGSRFARRSDLERGIDLVASGAVRPVVGLVRPLEDVNDVFEALERGEVAGRAVLDVERLGVVPA